MRPSAPSPLFEILLGGAAMALAVYAAATPQDAWLYPVALIACAGAGELYGRRRRIEGLLQIVRYLRGHPDSGEPARPQLH